MNDAKMARTVEAMSPERREIVENLGVAVEIDPALFSTAIIASLKANQYESHEALTLDSLLQTGEIVLEIGAGCGFISTYCAKKPTVKSVHCFEANPSMIPVIKRTHEINKVDVKVYNEILAREDGIHDFFVHNDFWASGQHEWLGQKISVPAASFQRRLDEIRPTMIIADIEGGEVDLFEDILLRGVTKIMLELHQPTIGRQGMKKVFDNLSLQGFHYDQHHSHYSVVTFSHINRT